MSADGSEQHRQMLSIERQELAMETLGMNLAESKALLEGVQDFMIEQQVRRGLGATAGLFLLWTAARY